MKHAAIFSMGSAACTFTSWSPRVNEACVVHYCTRPWALHAHNLTCPCQLLSVCRTCNSAARNGKSFKFTPKFRISLLQIAPYYYYALTTIRSSPVYPSLRPILLLCVFFGAPSWYQVEANYADRKSVV